MTSKISLFSIFTTALICFCGCSKTAETPDVTEYFSTEFDVKDLDETDIKAEIYEVSKIDGLDYSELSDLACYNGKLYLMQGTVAENQFEEAKTGAIIEYDLKTKAVKTIAQSSLPSLLPSDDTSDAVPNSDDLIFIDYYNRGFYDNKLVYEKSYLYALAGGFSEYYYYDMVTGESDLFFTPTSSNQHRNLAFLDGKVYFDDYSDERFSVYSYDFGSKTVNFEKGSAEAPIAYGGKILCYSNDGFYTLNNEFVFSPNSSGFDDVSEVRGGSILGFTNPVYDETGECAIGSAVGYYNPETFERNYILTSTADALYFSDLVSAGNFIAWKTGEVPTAFADVENGNVIVLSSDIEYSDSFVDEKNLNIVSFDLNDGLTSSVKVYCVEF